MHMYSASTARRLFWAVIALGAGASAPASAQESVVVAGDRVRLTFPCDSVRDASAPRVAPCTKEGTVARLTSERVELLVDGSDDAFELARLTSLAVRRVQAPGWKVPAASGAILGGVGTYAFLHSGGSTSRCDRSSNQDAMSGRECAGLTVMGTVAGAGLGFLVSRLLRTERWIPVPVGRVDVTVRWR